MATDMRAGYFETETEETTEWGVALLRKDGTTFTVRWDPQSQNGAPIYTEADARADAARPDRDGLGKQVVKRTRTVIHTEYVTDWKDA